MSRRRVAITGIGVIASTGRTTSEFWSSISTGTPGISPIEAAERNQLRFRNAAEVRGYRAEDYFESDRTAILDRFAQLGLIAAHEAIQASGVEWTPAILPRAGIVTGSALGGQSTQDTAFADLYLHKRSRVQPLSIPRVMANALASHISMETGITGPVFNISTACSSSNHALGHAFWMVREGMIDLAIAGGSDAPLTFGNLKAWEAMRVVSPDTCRPFSRNRSGIILGEGGGILVLEDMDRARARGAKLRGEIVGFGMTSDAHHITQPAAEGAGKAMTAAILDAGLRPESIGYINAHGTGTPTNDSVETAAIREVFGAHADRLAVSSTKSMHGHALGASGALEAVATVLALEFGLLPPTANYQEPDPECDLDVIPNQAREVPCEFALSNSFAFGGLNAVLAFRRPES